MVILRSRCSPKGQNVTSASLVFTIDTEPDDQWAMPASAHGPSTLTFANTRALGRLIGFLHERGLKATWLTSYSVARDPASVRILRDAAAAGDEIGGHLHAWETPPFAAGDSSAHPYIYEYLPDVQRAKLHNMTRALEDAFGKRPVSYRAGRWGIEERGIDDLADAGYEVDSSVVPGYTFEGSKGLEDGGPDFRGYLNGRPQVPFRAGRLWEVPASTTTVGALGNGGVSSTVARFLSQRPDIVSRAAIKALSVSGAMRLIWVRPLAHPRADLMKAALRLANTGASVINVMFHSSETHIGTSPRTRTPENVERLYGDLQAVATALLATGRIVPRTLSEALAVFVGAGAEG